MLDLKDLVEMAPRWLRPLIAFASLPLLIIAIAIAWIMLIIISFGGYDG